MGAQPPSFLRVFATSFTVVFIGEWGDVTQITTANFVARYNAPLIIGIAALTALWSVSALAVLAAPSCCSAFRCAGFAGPAR
jgi:putative Ca2+/H+ antiporter (TMEM165/GDT1 family)